ncbi:MAG: SLC13/DASS family transporter [Deltaproteobacteria bacterium]|nr:SLC13/DASS family transporter [Deltaproteobacteria bacterium]
MNFEIDKRPIWVLLAIKGLRPLFFLAVLILFLLINSINVDNYEGLSTEGRTALAIFAVCLLLWVSNIVPLAITSLFAIVLVPLLGVLPRDEAYALFGNEAVFFILGAFILAGAVMHSGLSNRIALAILERFGGSPKKLLFSIFFLSAALSCVMSEHAVAAMLFPIVLEIAMALELRPGRSGYGKLLFLSLAWGCVIGGVATFLGGARVPLAVGILTETTGKTIGFFQYSVAVFPLVIVMLIVGVIFLSKTFKTEIISVSKAHDVLSERIRSIGKVSYTEYATGVVLILTIIMWVVFGTSIGLASIALTSVVVLFALKLVRWKDIEEYVNWGIILMYGGAIILGTALERSGAALWIAEAIVGSWVLTPLLAIAFFSLFTLIFTEGISNAAVIAILLPVGIGLTGRFGIDPTIITFAIAVPAGLAFSLPLATPANAIAVSSNYVSVMDMVKVGVLMSLIAWVVFNLLARFYWPLIGMGMGG